MYASVAVVSVQLLPPNVTETDGFMGSPIFMYRMTVFETSSPAVPYMFVGALDM